MGGTCLSQRRLQSGHLSELFPDHQRDARDARTTGADSSTLQLLSRSSHDGPFQPVRARTRVWEALNDACRCAHLRCELEQRTTTADLSRPRGAADEAPGRPTRRYTLWRETR